jgi:hypothetical protein
VLENVPIELTTTTYMTIERSNRSRGYLWHKWGRCVPISESRYEGREADGRGVCCTASVRWLARSGDRELESPALCRMDGLKEVLATSINIFLT